VGSKDLVNIFFKGLSSPPSTNHMVKLILRFITGTLFSLSSSPLPPTTGPFQQTSKQPQHPQQQQQHPQQQQ
jgi:hypothetical protein